MCHLRFVRLHVHIVLSILHVEALKCQICFSGSKKFLLGDKPCEEDCGIFGLLAIFFYQSKGFPTQAILDGMLIALYILIHIFNEITIIYKHFYHVYRYLIKQNL